MKESEINRDYIRTQYISGIRKAITSNDLIPVIHLPNWYSKKYYHTAIAKLNKIKTIREDYPLSHRLDMASFEIDNLGQHTIEYLKLVFGISKEDFRKAKTELIIASWQDYKMIMEDDAKLGERILLVFDFSDKLPENSGGDLIFTNNGESSRLKAAPNSLTIVRAHENCQMCIGYLNHYAAKHKRKFAIITIEILSSILD